MKAFFLLAIVSFSAQAKDYGQGITSKDAPKTLTEAVKEIDSLQGKEIVIKSKITKVCQEMGCWMTLKEGPTLVRVEFGDHAFTIPKDSAQMNAVTQGKLFWKELSAAEARHYAKDEGRPKSEVAMIKKPVKTLWFDATGVRIE